MPRPEGCPRLRIALQALHGLRHAEAGGGARVSGPVASTRTRPGRNDPCWCGSGQKYKRCHLDADLRGAADVRPAPARRPLQPGVVSPRRAVPAQIARPEYAATGRPRSQGADVRTPDELARMRRACAAAARVLRVAGEAVRP